MSLFPPRVSVGWFFCAELKCLFQPRVAAGASREPRVSLGVLLVTSSGNNAEKGFCAELQCLFQPRVPV